MLTIELSRTAREGTMETLNDNSTRVHGGGGGGGGGNKL